jgi:hypothetical protein
MNSNIKPFIKGGHDGVEDAGAGDETDDDEGVDPPLLQLLMQSRAVEPVKSIFNEGRLPGQRGGAVKWNRHTQVGVEVCSVGVEEGPPVQPGGDLRADSSRSGLSHISEPSGNLYPWINIQIILLRETQLKINRLVWRLNQLDLLKHLSRLPVADPLASHAPL